MKIIYIFQSLAKTAGTERILTDKMNYLAEHTSDEITLITCEQGEHTYPFPLSPKVKHIDLNVRFFTLSRYGRIKHRLLELVMKREYRKRLKECLKQIQPDVICCTTYALFEISAVVRLAHGAASVVEAHTAKESNEKQQNFPPNSILRFIAKLYDNHVYRTIGKCQALVALTAGDAENWKNVKQAVVIPNMLGHYPAALKAYPMTNRVITVGRLTKQKGYDLLIDAWKIVHEHHPDWHLDIYGTGEDKEKLTHQVSQHNLNEVIHFHDPTPEIFDKYMMSDFYVMSSRWEGFSLVLIEAMSCGLPCVSFNCPHGPAEIIRNNEDGLIVENGNIEQFAEKINYLIEQKKVRQEMGYKARENVKRYLPENVMPEWLQLFESLTHSK